MKIFSVTQTFLSVLPSVQRADRNICPALLIFATLLFALPARAVQGVKLICAAPVFDFGTVNQTAVVTNVFVIKNAGDLSFALQSLQSSCSCTAVKIDRRMIGPGESASVTAVFTAAGRSGLQKRTIQLISADPAVPPFTLYVEGFVETTPVSD
ncbi:MAG: DUF1573 domain-containing protein [Kiritimatiellales bacterium]